MSGLVIAGSGLSLVDPAGSSVTLGIGATLISGGVGNAILYDNGGVLGEFVMGTGVQTALGIAVGQPGGFVTASSGGVLPVASGGTGGTTGLAAMTNLSGVYSLAVSGVSATTVGATEGTGIQLFVNVPANAWGANGVLEIDAFIDTGGTTSAATVRTRLSTGSGAGTGGTAFISTNVAANNTMWLKQRIANANSAGVQIGNTLVAINTSTSNLFATANTDTTQATVLRLNVFMGTGGGTVNVRSLQAKLVPAS